MPLLERYPILCLVDYRERITPQMYNNAVEAAIVFSADYTPRDTRNRFESLRYEPAKSVQGDLK